MKDLSQELELADWKEIERSAEMDLRTSKKIYVVCRATLEMARYHIKKLGGKTNPEIDAEAKANTSKMNDDLEVG